MWQLNRVPINRTYRHPHTPTTPYGGGLLRVLGVAHLAFTSRTLSNNTQRALYNLGLAGQYTLLDLDPTANLCHLSASSHSPTWGSANEAKARAAP
jgi:hypothetical protein